MNKKAKEVKDDVKPGEIEINNINELTEQLGELIKDPSLNKPSGEEVFAAQKEFETAAQAFTTKHFKIGAPEDAQELTDYMIHFMRNRFLWQKEAWMGTIKLVEELEAAEAVFKGDKEKGLEVGYQALEFMFYALSNPGGVGLQSAKDFEAENEVFIKLATAVGDQTEEARRSLKDIEFLQQKWGAMAQGFYLEVEPGPDEEIPGEEELPEGVEEEPID